MSKVSIVFPTFNRRQYIPDAIESVIAQTYPDWELLVVDDGSTDQTRELIESYIRQDKRVRYIYQENAGEYSATNTGLKAATGDYITIMHSDDYMPPDSLKIRVVALDSNASVEAVHGDMEKTDSGGKAIEYLKAATDPAEEVLKHYCMEEDKRSAAKYYVHFPTFMIRKESLDKVGYFDASLKFGGDLDWMMRILSNCSILCISEKLYSYKRHAGAISQVNKRDKLPIKAITESIQERYCKVSNNLHKE